jgi:hypothetical protein
MRIRGFDGQKLSKFTAENFFNLFFGSEIAIYFSLGLHTGKEALSYDTSQELVSFH